MLKNTKKFRCHTAPSLSVAAAAAVGITRHRWATRSVDSAAAADRRRHCSPDPYGSCWEAEPAGTRSLRPCRRPRHSHDESLDLRKKTRTQTEDMFINVTLHLDVFKENFNWMKIGVDLAWNAVGWDFLRWDIPVHGDLPMTSDVDSLALWLAQNGAFLIVLHQHYSVCASQPPHLRSRVALTLIAPESDRGNRVEINSPILSGWKCS